MELELAPLNLPSDNERPFVIAGPCSAETEEQVMNTAKQLAMKGCHNFRAGVWKLMNAWYSLPRLTILL